jgi:hypothetical protein
MRRQDPVQTDELIVRAMSRAEQQEFMEKHNKRISRYERDPVI